MATLPRKLLIIGGGFAGLECARRLADDERFEITLIDRTNHHLFQPLLYQVASASLAAPDIARSIRQILADAKNVTVLMDEISSIDTIEKVAVGKTGCIYPYDTLLLAAGARTSFFGNDEWEKHSLGLKSLADAQNIRRTILSNLEKAELTSNDAELNRLMTVAIVGGGPTGVELAGAFADLVHRSLKSNFRRIDTSKLRIILIEGSELILETFDPHQSQYARKRLEKLGVEVWNNTRVTAVREGALDFKDGRTLEAAAIIWAAGVAASPLTASLGIPLERGGRIKPNADLSVPGHPDIFVAGDLVSMKDIDDKMVPGVAPAAVQMGTHIAKILKSQASGENKRPGFRYFDKGMMAIIGKNYAVVKTDKFEMQGFVAWMAWLFVHIAFLIGFRNKLSVLLGWAYAYVVNTPEARIIVYPPASVAPGKSAPEV
ncbi:MAG: NAD(P)/FAD-dependent oxidoreductase [Verrucomicrobiaceae bacterium]|nr:MAG: NAD(P)/FAD-dependent oxidoreductase [Verrucomicrobiaceae bacterium]